MKYRKLKREEILERGDIWQSKSKTTLKMSLSGGIITIFSRGIRVITVGDWGKGHPFITERYYNVYRKFCE